MPSTDVVREMRTVARFEELATTPLLAKVLNVLRQPGVATQIGVSKDSSNGIMLRALADVKSPSNMLRSFGLDLSSAVKAEATLLQVINSEAKPVRIQSQQQERGESNRECRRRCSRCCTCIAVSLTVLLLLGSMAFLGFGLWMQEEDWELHYFNRTWTPLHLFYGSIGTGGLALTIVLLSLSAFCCSGCCYRCCSQCYAGIRGCCLCRCRCCQRRRIVADDDKDSESPQLSEVQVVALRQLSRQLSGQLSPQLSGQLSPQLSSHLTSQLSEQLALANSPQHSQLSEQLALMNSPYQSPQGNSGQSQLALWGADMTGTPAHATSPQNFRMEELAVYNPSEAPAMLHSPSLGSSVYSGLKSVSFEHETSDYGTTVVTVANKASPSTNDPNNYAWHSPGTHSFAAKFMGMHSKREATPDPDAPGLSEEERFKLMAKKMRMKKNENKVTFPQYADNVVGDPRREMETLRRTCKQFYVDTMFQSKPVYPDWHPDSEKSVKEQEQLREMAAAVTDVDPPQPLARPSSLRRPLSSPSMTSSQMMMSPGRLGLEDSTGPGNVLGLTAPASFKAAPLDLGASYDFSAGGASMLSPASTASNGRFMMGATSPSQFPYRPQPKCAETDALSSWSGGNLRDAAFA